MQRARQSFGNLDALIGRPVRDWEHVLAPSLRPKIPRDLRLEQVGESLLARAKQLGISVAFSDDPAYPARLREIADAPPLLFHIGPGAAAPPRRRVAMVGTRHPDHPFWRKTRELVEPVVRSRVGVVSGAAIGIDTWCHLIAAAGGGETWGFLGSAIDQMDPSPRRLWRRIEKSGATLFSEYPIGVRAEAKLFPRRNRLISGSADAVVVLRATLDSGAGHTVKYALRQNRPVLAMVGDPDNVLVGLCNDIVHKGEGTMCMGYIDIIKAIGASTRVGHSYKPHTEAHVPLTSLSAVAQKVFPQVSRDSCTFDDVQALTQLPSGELGAALFELESAGFVIRHAAGRLQQV